MRRFKKVSTFRRYAGRLPPKCGCPAANTRSPRSDGRHPAEARSERKKTAAAKGDLVPRAARSTNACAVLASTPTRSGRIQISRATTKSQRETRQRRTQWQARGKKLRTPFILAENRRARRRRKPFCVQYVRLRALLVTERKDGAAAARKAIAAAFCAPQTPRSGVFPLRASPAPSAIIIPYFGENDKDSSKDFSQIAKFYPSFIFFS